MAEYIDREEFLKRIKPYNTEDKTEKALYNFALNKMMETPTADVIPIPEGATYGDMVKAPFLNYCEDLKTITEEDEDGEEYKVHLVHIVGSQAINRYDEIWWNAKYDKEAWWENL